MHQAKGIFSLLIYTANLYCILYALTLHRYPWELHRGRRQEKENLAVETMSTSREIISYLKRCYPIAICYQTRFRIPCDLTPHLSKCRKESNQIQKPSTLLEPRSLQVLLLECQTRMGLSMEAEKSNAQPHRCKRRTCPFPYLHLLHWVPPLAIKGSMRTFMVVDLSGIWLYHVGWEDSEFRILACPSKSRCSGSCILFSKQTDLLKAPC